MSQDEQPSPMQVRAIERDGRRYLQQWRQTGRAWEYGWVDVCELPPAPVIPLPKRPAT